MNADKIIRTGALLGFSGFLSSGPVAVFIVLGTHPQPEWISVSLFVNHYHPIQTLPYYLGFLILAGMLLLSVGQFIRDFQDHHKMSPRLFFSVVLTIIFAGMIAFNYVSQISFIPNLVEDYRPEYESLIAGISMSNPRSFCWANEMWGYCFLGWATWTSADFYKDKSKPIRFLMAGNGVISMISPAWTIINPDWVMSSTGMGLYLFWNIWMIIMMLAILIQSKHWVDPGQQTSSSR